MKSEAEEFFLMTMIAADGIMCGMMGGADGDWRLAVVLIISLVVITISAAIKEGRDKKAEREKELRRIRNRNVR